MNRYGKAVSVILSAALVLALSSCKPKGEGWDDSLPSVVTDPSSAALIYEPETTTTTESITVTTPEKTSRTAFSETEPALATTTGTISGEEAAELSTISVVPDVPKVPISEFTSTTPMRPEVSSASASGTASSATLEEKNEDIYVVYDPASTEFTESVTGTPIAGRDAIVRPYSYNFLDDKHLYVYDALVTAIENRKSNINFSSVMGITAEDYCDVYQLLYNDENAMFYLDTKMQYSVNTNTKNVAAANINYKYSDAEINRMQNGIETEVNKLLGRITANMSDYDIVKLFYDYLAENVVYVDDTENCRDLYGVFVEKQALCGGYAKAFSYLCGLVGIENLTITGDADEVPHMWNMVKLGGEWYHIDPTYAVTESPLGLYVRYDYFCVTDEVIARSRQVYDQDYSYPAATAKACNYYVKNGLVADSWDDVTAMLKNQIVAASRKKELVAQVQCSSKETYDTAVYRLFDRTQAQAITLMEDALKLAPNKYQCENISYSQDDSTYVIKLFLEYTS